MIVLTANVASVKRIVSTSPSNQDKQHPVVVTVVAMAGSDKILVLSGIEAGVAKAVGTTNIAPEHMLVGLGNKFVP
jgi:histidinol dehydrogenase